MSDQPLDLRIAPSVVTVQCTYDWRFGWTARVALPIDGGRRWLSETYGPCSPSELVDAVSSALAVATGAARELA